VRRLWLLCAVLAGGCALSVEGELPDVEVARHGVIIPGVPVEAPLGDASVYVSVTVNPKDDLDVDPSSYHSVKVREVVFSATSDLSFVRALDLTMRGSRAADAPVAVLHYEHPAGQSVGNTLTLPVDPPVEVVTAWRDSPATIGLEVKGVLPPADWSLDVAVHLSATVGY
jgi:hypothetical protein